MSLKDFSFAQLDKKARLSVGTVEKKSNKDTSSVARTHCVTRHCSVSRW